MEMSSIESYLRSIMEDGEQTEEYLMMFRTWWLSLSPLTRGSFPAIEDVIDMFEARS